MRALAPVTTLAAFLALAPLPGWADAVDPAQVTAFENGQPADADEMNATLQALIAAIDDNAARVAALEASQAAQDGALAGEAGRIDALEGSQTGQDGALAGLEVRVVALESGAPSAAGLAGTWRVFGLEVEASGRDDGLGGWGGGYRQESVLTLNPDGSFTLDEAFVGTRVIHTAFKVPCDGSVPEGAQCVGDLQIHDFPDAESEADAGTWSVSGQTLSLSFPGDDPSEYTLAPGGGLFVATSQEDDVVPDGPSTQRSRIMGLSVGVKVATP